MDTAGRMHAQVTAACRNRLALAARPLADAVRAAALCHTAPEVPWTTLLLIRHGHTRDNTLDDEARLLGWHDSPLSPLGAREARLLAISLLRNVWLLCTPARSLEPDRRQRHWRQCSA
jgi:hypothetical protein